MGAFVALNLISLRLPPSAGTNAAPEHVSLGPAWAPALCLPGGVTVTAPVILSLGLTSDRSEDVDGDGRQATEPDDQGGHHNLTKRKPEANGQVAEMPGAAVLICGVHFIACLCDR